MITKETVKNEIDLLSEAQLEKVHQYLESLNKEGKRKRNRKIPSYKLDGKLDNKNIRAIAYE